MKSQSHNARTQAISKRPHLLIAGPDNTIYTHPTLEMAIDDGAQTLRPGKRDYMDLKQGWDLMRMPGTVPIGYNPETGKFEEVLTFQTTNEAGESMTIKPSAVAVHPPPGHVRAYHPAARFLESVHPDEQFKKSGGGLLPIVQNQQKVEENNVLDTKGGGDDSARPGLPLWAYTAVGMGKTGPVASLFVADEMTRWGPELYYQEDLKVKIEKRLAADPDNQILNQLADCAGSYLCCCAQNIFYERWEGAVPCAPACTARCLGCLSKDPEWDTPTPQKRLKFSPKADDIARVMIHHLENSPEPMVSFGQGCEGEPCMYGDVMVESITLTRAATSKGVINVNTNGSRPGVIRRAAAAGLGALRVSINTFDPDVYTAYYRPQDYDFDTVIESLKVGHECGLYNSINFLIWPGWTDRIEEMDRVSELVDKGWIQMIQLRNLCVDPGHFRSMLPSVEKRGLVMGMHAFVSELHRRHPKLRFGTFNPRLAAEWYADVPSWVKNVQSQAL